MTNYRLQSIIIILTVKREGQVADVKSNDFQENRESD